MTFISLWLWSWSSFARKDVSMVFLHVSHSSWVFVDVQNGGLDIQSSWPGQVPINGSFICGRSGWRDNDWSTQCSKWKGCGAFPWPQVSHLLFVLSYLGFVWQCIMKIWNWRRDWQVAESWTKSSRLAYCFEFLSYESLQDWILGHCECNREDLWQAQSRTGVETIPWRDYTLWFMGSPICFWSGWQDRFKNTCCCMNL